MKIQPRADREVDTNQQFKTRSWVSTSKLICEANRLPPGFRIIAENAKSLNFPARVRSGEFCEFPVSWPVAVFLAEGVGTCVKEDLSEWPLKLEDHRGNQIKSNTTLRRVRDMAGSYPNPAFDDEPDLLCELDHELEDALGIFDPDIDHRLASDPEVFLKALMSYILRKYDVDALELALSINRLDVRKKRAEERRRWAHLVLNKK